MSGLDLMGGVAVSRFWGNRDLANAEAEAANWKQKANRLQHQLGVAEEKQLFRQVEFDANDYVLKLALEALKAANPNSPLLAKANRDTLRRQHMAASLAQKGYRFDVKTGEVESKLR
ncbi:hypothetical protein [Chromobacterium haemolyticum]|uniref:hypothetical protein n=1 Tax=Chromobacterium haemolyticum TaxID=394935 RepID=UPI00244A850A|nr:hypothetical protein [Chromobacterium haemolyticum]MDH0342172.1 hypothetical protein [Chromobacterium haemolyticum]